MYVRCNNNNIVVKEYLSITYSIEKLPQSVYINKHRFICVSPLESFKNFIIY